MIFVEVSDKESVNKIIKVIGKKIISKGKVQINLMDGRNIITDEKVKLGDSVLFNFKTKKLEKIIALAKGGEAHVIEGKHAGKKGKIIEIISRGGKDLVVIENKPEKINVMTKSVIAV